MTKNTTTTPDYLGHRRRLRERFLQNNGKTFQDYELLELLLTTAIPRRDVKPLAKELLRRFGNFAKVLNASKADLCAVSGIKESTYVLFRLAIASVERAAWQGLREKNTPVLLTQDALLEYCRTAITFSDVEELHLLYLDNKLKVIGQELFQRGTIDAVSAYPREIVRAVLANDASAVIMVHNHPSGDVTPSPADVELTKKVKSVFDALNVELTDHLIVSNDDFFSFKYHQLLSTYSGE